MRLYLRTVSRHPLTSSTAAGRRSALPGDPRPRPAIYALPPDQEGCQRSHKDVCFPNTCPLSPRALRRRAAHKVLPGDCLCRLEVCEVILQTFFLACDLGLSSFEMFLGALDILRPREFPESGLLGKMSGDNLGINAPFHLMLFLYRAND
jgi:hypothetical protein